MWLQQVDNSLLIQLILFAVGLSYVVTGSLIGFPVRVIGYKSLSWCPVPLSTIFFCPSCNAWWMGAGLGLWANLPWQNALQVAFTACAIAAIIQAQWELAADDKEQVAKIFEKETANDEEVGT